MKGRFDCGRIRAHYVLMRLPNEAHWLRYKKVVEGANVSCLEVVVENGHRKKDLQSVDGIGGDEHEGGVDVDTTPGNMDLDGHLTQEQLHSSLMVIGDSRQLSVGCINDDFDVN